MEDPIGWRGISPSTEGWTQGARTGAVQLTQNGSTVTARNLSYNGTVSPGAPVTFGHHASMSDSYSAPNGFTLNGTTCTRI
ncbi:Cellulose binding domain-containing protein [Micromonospora inyonensis]|uniref:Cellulose binding domain-containing protein n=1 Tax=Micromonospora inyonensis TaxID=47866 RepID=A0A1C6RRE6_9ACTN|nr:Cellulose binding domain-containing protein [Micromonospora inyonensis]